MSEAIALHRSPRPFPWRPLCEPVVYVVWARALLMLRISYTTRLASRLEELRSASPDRLALLLTTPGSLARKDLILSHLRRSLSHGEWLHATADVRAYLRRLAAVEGAIVEEAFTVFFETVEAP